jgi:hypothetical protein
MPQGAARASLEGCPRCGSDLIGAAPSGAPSLRVLELRSGTAPARRGSATSLCRSCGHQWEAGQSREPWDGEHPEPEASDGAAPSPGLALRRAREGRAESLSQAAARTRIWDRHLEALEGDASLDEFPAPAYARFFLREYAEHLRLDPGPLLREFDARHPVVEEAPLEPLPDRRGRHRIAAGFLTALSVAALVAIAIVSFASRPDAGEEPPATVPAGEVTVHDRGRLEKPDPSAPVFEGIRAVLRLTEPSWVQVVADGAALEAATRQPGESLVYRARHRLELRLGNAGGVELRVNGEAVPTGGPGDVVDLAVRWRDGEVTTTVE